LYTTGRGLLQSAHNPQDTIGTETMPGLKRIYNILRYGIGENAGKRKRAANGNSVKYFLTENGNVV